jgi:(2Fe-2S) ferredoxin
MSKTRKSPFRLVGQLEGYELSKRGKVRYLRLTTAQGLQQLKLGQSSRLDLLRGVLNGLVFQGAWLEILGQQKVYSDGTLKSLKVEALRALQDSSDFREPKTDPPNPLPRRSTLPAKILICQKSSCRKRGSMAVQRSLEKELCDRQLLDQVCVKATGCLNQCSKGPILFMNKTPYRNVTVKNLGKILDQHFASCPTITI